MNTLEQIKEKQEQINESLLNLLRDTRVVTERLVGTQVFPDSKAIDISPNGLIEEILNIQRDTETSIARLFEYSRTLSESVFSPQVLEPTNSTGAYKHNVVTTIG